jgi:PAS domain S-box-containing protein
VLFNAVPLLVLAALYLTVGIAASPGLRRGRRGTRRAPGSSTLVAPCLGLAAGILGILVLVEREPLAGHVWLSLAALVVAAVPAVDALLAGKGQDGPLLAEPDGRRDRQLETMARLSRSLLDAEHVPEVSRIVLDELSELFDLDVANLCLIEPEPGVARVVGARERGRENERLLGQTIDLSAEASGIATTVRDGTAFAVFDVETSAVVNKRLNAIAQVKSCAFVPVVASDEVIGVVFAGVRRPRLFREDELALMQTFASEAGLALARARSAEALSEALEREAAGAVHMTQLLRESERRLAEQTALLNAGQALTSELRFDSVINRLVEEMRGLVDADAAYCWTLAPGGDALVCRAVLGLPASEVGRRIPIEGTIGEALATGKPVLKRDFATTEQPPPSANYANFAEVVDAPIFSFGETRGVLGVCSKASGRFDESDLRLTAAFASLSSIALRNAEAFEERARQAQVESGFYRIAAVLSEPLSAEATRDAVAQAAVESLGGDFAAVLRAGSGRLSLAGSHELPEGLAGFLASDSEPELADVARAGKVLASRILRDDTRFGEGLVAAAVEAGSRSLLAIPLAQPRSETGGVVLVLFREERAFTDEQLELARHVAGAARGALERSELYELERRARSLAQRLARSSRELASELDPDDVLDEAVALAAGLVESDEASAWIFDADELVVLAAHGAGAGKALGSRSDSTVWPLGDIVGSRGPRAIANAAEDTRAGEADSMLRACGAYLGVPIIGPEGDVQGVLAVYDRRPREWREEEAEALIALAASAAAARTNAELYQGVRHEQQRSEAILANVADGIVAVDRDAQVVLWNPAAEQITGVPAKDALGRTTLQALGRALESEVPGVGGNRLVAVRRGGEEAWLSLSEAVMTDPAGGVAGRIFAFRDISVERAVEQMKSDFVSTVSHELRTPLTSIYGFAETLLRQDVLFGDAERETFLRYIASESERLTAIVDRLLSVAQLDTGAMRVQLATTDIGKLVSEAVSTAADALGENGHRFVVTLEEGPLAAEADRDKLGQVLSHLLDNAVRYSPAGGTVTVAARRTASAVEVRVEDEGVGIPRVEHDRIFRKFYRGESAARTVGAGATGLGLFLAEGLVTAMGGRIWVDSDEGRGATFVFELPAAGA